MSSSAGALAIPAAVVALLHALMLTAAVAGRHPFWQAHPINLSEAAALHDAGEVARLIGQGEDPNRRRDVRAGLIRDDASRLTPLEAAVAEDRPEIVALLLHHGALLEPDTWTGLHCLAGRSSAAGARSYLETVRPPAASASCDGVAPPW